MLEQGEILTLSDNKNYSVVYSAMIGDINYAYLVDQDDYSNSFVCKFDNNDGIEEENNPEIIGELMTQFINTREQI